MDRELLFQVLFAAGVAVVASSVLLAALGHAPQRTLRAGAGLIGAAAVAAWIVFALGPTSGLAVAATGLTISAAAEAMIPLLSRTLARGRRVEGELAAAEAHLHEVIEREAAERAVELERTLSRARAESVSRLAEEERRIAEQRRSEVVEREKGAAVELGRALAGVQERVELRLAEWAQDLDRAQQKFATEVARLGERQRPLVAEAEARMAAIADRLEAESEAQRASVVRLRQEIAKVAEDAAAAGTAEIETATVERRRAQRELDDRMRRHEEALAEHIEREQAEATRRIQAGFEEVERRQVEQLERVVSRAAASFSDAAAKQFSDAIKSAREDAARRLARELDRAVQAFAREASSVLAERMAHVGDAGAQRVEKRLSQISAGLERQRDDFLEAFERRFLEAEAELRRHFEGVVADTEAERAVLRARLEEIARRVDELVVAANERLSALEGLRTR